MSSFGLIEKNMDLSHIYLAVLVFDFVWSRYLMQVFALQLISLSVFFGTLDKTYLIHSDLKTFIFIKLI